jgi:hypothetical protein
MALCAHAVISFAANNDSRQVLDQPNPVRAQFIEHPLKSMRIKLTHTSFADDLERKRFGWEQDHDNGYSRIGCRAQGGA